MKKILNPCDLLADSDDYDQASFCKTNQKTMLIDSSPSQKTIRHNQLSETPQKAQNCGFGPLTLHMQKQRKEAKKHQMLVSAEPQKIAQEQPTDSGPKYYNNQYTFKKLRSLNWFSQKE